jgi:hypothetical protein
MTESGRYRILIIYFVLLVIFHVVRMLQPDPWPPLVEQMTVSQKSQGCAPRAAEPVQMRYLDSDPQNSARKPVVPLFHGRPLAAGGIFEELIAGLSPRLRLIAPDLPGFGRSTRDIDDYGFEAHAACLRQFVDRLGIDAVSKGFQGFYFGRYDVRAPSVEAFWKGREFRILELNGVTS